MTRRYLVILIVLGVMGLSVYWLGPGEMAEVREQRAAEPRPRVELSVLEDWGWLEAVSDGRCEVSCQHGLTNASLSEIEFLVFADSNLRGPDQGLYLPAREALLGRSRRFKADAQGLAILPQFEVRTQVVAASDDWICFGWMQPMETKVSMKFWPTRPILVRVRDEEGRAVSGLQMSWNWERHGGNSPSRIARLVTDEKGDCRFYVPQLTQYSPLMESQLSALGPDEAAFSRRIGFKLDEAETWDFVVADYGGVEVRVDSERQSNPDDRPSWVELAAVVNGKKNAEIRPEDRPLLAEVHDGKATFPFVPVNHLFRVELNYGDCSSHLPVTKTILGPRRKFEVVDSNFNEVEARQSFVQCGRLLDENSEPLASSRFRLRSHCRSEPYSTMRYWLGRTDAEGKFILPVDQGEQAPDCESPELRLEFSYLRPDGIRCRRVLISSEFNREDKNLGDIPLVSDPVLLSGRVLSPEGQPMTGAHVRPQCKVLFHDDFRMGGHWEDTETRTDGQGYFELRGRCTGAVVPILVGKEGFDQHAASCPPGTKNLEFVLAPLSGLKLKLLREDGCSPFELSCCLKLESEISGANVDDRWELSESGLLDCPLPAGSYFLRVTPTLDPKNILFQKRRIELKAGAVLDLGTVTIPAYRFHVDAEVEGLDLSEEALRWRGWGAGRRIHLARKDHVWDIDSGRLQVKVARLPLDLTLDFACGGPERVRILSPTKAIRLDPPPRYRCELILSGWELIPEGVHFEISLGEEDPLYFLGPANSRTRRVFSVEEPGRRSYAVTYSSGGRDYFIAASQHGEIDVKAVEGKQTFTILLDKSIIASVKERLTRD